MTRFNIPEVIQTSAMDCGPATLAALLNGFGIPISYPRLREVCQTDMDGTSIDTLEVLANRFGLGAEQVMLPNDFVFRKSDSNLPCIAVVTLPNGLTHFVVLWRVLLGYVQVMDPARGRSWMQKDKFLESLYQHETSVDAQDWLVYAQTDEFKTTILEGLLELGIDSTGADSLIAGVVEQNTWTSMALLDAAIRMCRSLRDAGEKISSADAFRLLQALLDAPDLVPEHYYQITHQVTYQDTDGASKAEANETKLKGAVLVRISGVSDTASLEDPVVARTRGPFRIPLLRHFQQLTREAGMNHVAAGLGSVSLLVAVITFIEALVFRYLIGAQLPTELPMLALIAFVVIAPLVAAIALESGGMRMAQALGRQLDTSLQARLLRKLPRMSDGYFSSRLISDLAERGHAITQIREIPELARQIMIVVFRIALLLMGLVWLLPEQILMIGAAGAIALLAPVAIFPALAERDMRARTHLGALSRFYLDSLRGSEAIWAHGAAGSMQHEQENLLLKWVQAVKEFQRPSILFELVQIVALGAISVALVSRALQTPMSPGSMLLVAYWSLFMPILSRQLTATFKQLPAINNVARRVLELLDAPEETVESPTTRRRRYNRGVSIQFVAATVTRGNLPLIEDVNVKIEPGEQIAIIGASGSGKSSFLGVVSGWYPLTKGEFLIDGEPATSTSIADLREHTTLIDPDLYLWNRSLFDNISYGCEGVSATELEFALYGSEVINDLQKMADGLATTIGENGSRLSGGEGQRLRIARGLVRPDQRLVLLDEPFTGMDTSQRTRMRLEIMKRWPEATMLFVSHHVTECSGFHRVLIFKGGHLVEDGEPRSLMSQPRSIYAGMIEAERRLQRHMDESSKLTHRQLRDGEIYSL